jgi:TetR/AcrR family transcriptional regulator of autoinduction and epiphytic fitness
MVQRESIPDGEGGRKYVSPLREEQARNTRRAILGAAEALFREKGYVGTSIRAIAAEAGVSESTVYQAFTDKATLLWAVTERVVAGTDEPVHFSDLDILNAIRAEPDPRGRLRMIAHWSRETFERGIAQLEEVIAEAAASSPDLRELARHASNERFEAVLMIAGVVREAVPQPPPDIEKLAEFIWAVDSSPVYRMLVEERGWSPQEYEDWIYQFYCWLALGDPPSGRDL